MKNGFPRYWLTDWPSDCGSERDKQSHVEASLQIKNYNEINQAQGTMCPGSSFPILYSKLLYKMGKLLSGHMVNALSREVMCITQQLNQNSKS